MRQLTNSTALNLNILGEVIKYNKLNESHGKTATLFGKSMQSVSNPERHKLISVIEQLIRKLREDLRTTGRTVIYLINTANWENYETINERLSIRQPSANGTSLRMRKISYNNKSMQKHFTLVLYVLAEVHRLLLVGGRCSPRELYYKNTQLTRNQASVQRAIADVCSMLERAPWQLGIIASGKGIMAGDLRIHISNGDVIDCNAYEGATLIPSDFHNVEYLETSAAFVLLLEKDTVFAKLLAQNALRRFGVPIILVSGKGFPDLCTRLLLQRLQSQCHLPIYALVDADPYGIEIMLVYRYGSRACARNADELACPQIRWIGVHPSEMYMMNLVVTPLSARDKKKIAELLKRDYLSAGIKHELEMLGHLQHKAEIENMSALSMDFLINDYIPNKIRRNLLI